MQATTNNPRVRSYKKGETLPDTFPLTWADFDHADALYVLDGFWFAEELVFDGGPGVPEFYVIDGRTERVFDTLEQAIACLEGMAWNYEGVPMSDRLYIGDNGRVNHGRCLGYSARTTGRDLCGCRVVEFPAEDLNKPWARCESCEGRDARCDGKGGAS